MRKASLLFIVAAVFTSQAWPDEKPWSAGYAESDITPAPGQVQMSGFGRERYARGVLAPLLTQVIVLRDGENKTGEIASQMLCSR